MRVCLDSTEIKNAGPGARQAWVGKAALSPAGCGRDLGRQPWEEAVPGAVKTM